MHFCVEFIDQKNVAITEKVYMYRRIRCICIGEFQREVQENFKKTPGEFQENSRRTPGEFFSYLSEFHQKK